MTDASTREFEEQRPFLTGLAYRMLGSLADAQDIVQDAFLRWNGRTVASLDNPRAFLATIVTRLCLDRTRSARHRRESYVGPWLPEPIVERLGGEAARLPDDRIDAPVALMLALERLSPLERAVFILQDLMEMEPGDVAAALGRSRTACRALLSRARAHVGDARPRFRVDPQEGRQVATAFFDAVRTGRVEPLRDLLAASVRFQSDGGGKVMAVRNTLEGADRVFRFYAGIYAKGQPAIHAWSGIVSVNGLPGYVSVDAAGIIQTTSFAVEAGRIVAIYIVRNPEKLEHVRALAVQPVGAR